MVIFSRWLIREWGADAAIGELIKYLIKDESPENFGECGQKQFEWEFFFYIVIFGAKTTDDNYMFVYENLIKKWFLRN